MLYLLSRLQINTSSTMQWRFIGVALFFVLAAVGLAALAWLQGRRQASLLALTTVQGDLLRSLTHGQLRLLMPRDLPRLKVTYINRDCDVARRQHMETLLPQLGFDVAMQVTRQPAITPDHGFTTNAFYRCLSPRLVSKKRSAAGCFMSHCCAMQAFLDAADGEARESDLLLVFEDDVAPMPLAGASPALIGHHTAKLLQLLPPDLEFLWLSYWPLMPRSIGPDAAMLAGLPPAMKATGHTLRWTASLCMHAYALRRSLVRAFLQAVQQRGHAMCKRPVDLVMQRFLKQRRTRGVAVTTPMPGEFFGGLFRQARGTFGSTIETSM
jgi:GR25 family glycosyltransferase involved in LPS biosynthesis